MMCNPNILPNGAEQLGSKTGSSPQITNPFHNELLEKSLQEISKTVSKLRAKWLKKKLLLEGIPSWMMDGIEERHPLTIQSAGEWLRARRYAWGCREFNTMQLYQNGDLLHDEEIFHMPMKYENVIQTYRREFF
jgi:hypothetical protein